MSSTTLDYLPLNEDTEPTYKYLANLLCLSFEENVSFTESGLASQCWVWLRGMKVGYLKADGGRTNRNIRGLAYDHAYPDLRESTANIQDICGNEKCCNPDHLTASGWDFMVELEHLALTGASAFRIQEALGLTAPEVDNRINYYISVADLTKSQARAIYAYRISSIIEQVVSAEDLEDPDIRRATLSILQQNFTEQQYTLNRRLKAAAALDTEQEAA